MADPVQQPPGGAPPPAAPPPAAPPPDAGAAPPPAISAPWKNGEQWKLGEGDKATPWFETIPEVPVRDLMKAKNYNNPAELAMAYHNLNKTFNDKNALTIPADPKDAKAWDAFYTKLGRPAAADKYEIKIKEGTTPNDAMLNFGKKLFFDMGASPEKAQAGYDAWEGFVAEQQKGFNEAVAKQNETDLAALTTKWGADLEKNKAAGLRVAKSLGLPDTTMAAIESNIGAAALVELLASIGRKTDEGTFKSGGQGDPTNPDNMTPEQATAKIATLRGDKAFMDKFENNMHPEHNDAVKQLERLYAKSK